MQTIGISLLGFGNVGRAFAQLLLEKQGPIQQQYDLAFNVVGIKTGRHGTAIDASGIDLLRALEILDKGGSLAALSQPEAPEEVIAFIEASAANVMAENTPVSYADGQPALDHIRAALGRGIHVITANKGPVVHAHRELRQLATESGCRFLFESTVMDGAPIFSMWREALPAAELASFRGVLNSTTNLILTRMESGESFDAAVAYAQSIGIAETDPSGDIDGWDAAVKVAALVNVLMGVDLLPQDVEREGIGALDANQVQTALKNGQRWKLICQAHREQSGIFASVQPQLVDRSDPLFAVLGTSSAITFHSDVLGALTVTEADPGPHTTAYGLLADLLNIYRNPA
ncbi:MAG: homoserine dehydrogenase [Anaerolineales bacterium]|nr:MAG: homoserine dehydrogenase [Anaerolineales bacterium]